MREAPLRMLSSPLQLLLPTIDLLSSSSDLCRRILHACLWMCGPLGLPSWNLCVKLCVPRCKSEEGVLGCARLDSRVEREVGASGSDRSTEASPERGLVLLCARARLTTPDDGGCDRMGPLFDIMSYEVLRPSPPVCWLDRRRS